MTRRGARRGSPAATFGRRLLAWQLVALSASGGCGTLVNIEDRYLASEPRDGAAGGDGTVGTGDAARGVDRDGELEAFSEPETPARPDPGAATDAGAPMGHDVEASGDADASAPPDEADASEESAPPDGSNGGLSGVDGAVDVPVGPSCDGPSIPGCPGAQCSIVAFSVAKFSALTPYLTYVLHVDGSLWRQSGDSTPDELVDTNVRDFSAVDAETVYVLGNDRVLRVETAGGRTPVDSDVIAVQALDPIEVYVERSDHTLWLEGGSASSPILIDYDVVLFQGVAGWVDVLFHHGDLSEDVLAGQMSLHLDSYISSFRAVPGDPQTIYVRDIYGRLWNQRLDGAGLLLVDTAVNAFVPVDSQTVFVQGSDGNLWREVGTGFNRVGVNAKATLFQPLGTDTVYVVDGQCDLWRQSVVPLASGLAISVNVQDTANGPNICMSGSGFSPGATVGLFYSGIPHSGGPMSGFASTTAHADGHGGFGIADYQESVSKIPCSDAQRRSVVTITATDGRVDAGTGAAVSATVPGEYWCSNGSPDAGAGLCPGRSSPVDAGLDAEALQPAMDL